MATFRDALTGDHRSRHLDQQSGAIVSTQTCAYRRHVGVDAI
jgi:hypothetical protein